MKVIGPYVIPLGFASMDQVLRMVARILPAFPHVVMLRTAFMWKYRLPSLASMTNGGSSRPLLRRLPFCPSEDPSSSAGPVFATHDLCCAAKPAAGVSTDNDDAEEEGTGISDDALEACRAVREDKGTLKWDMQSAEQVHVPGGTFTQIAFAKGPQSYDRQVVVISCTDRHNLVQGIDLGILRRV